MKYMGRFEYFCEMGGGPSLMFKDVKTKYLHGYSELDMCYFIKYQDELKINGVMYKFTMDYIEGGDVVLVPEGLTFNQWREFINKKDILKIEVDKKLYDNLIIVDPLMTDNEIEENLNRILKENNLSKRQEGIKKELIFYLKNNNSVLDYVRKKDFFGLSAFDIFLNNGSIISKK